MIEIFFQPLQVRWFLPRTKEAGDGWAVFLIGSGLTSWLYLLLWFSWGRLRREGHFAGRWGGLKLATIVAFIPIFGFGAGILITTKGWPLARHHLTETTESRVPFVVEGRSFSSRCRGLRASHPDYGEVRLCGIRTWGHSDLWRGRTVHVTGQLSEHGLIWERYRVEPPVPREDEETP